MNPLLNASSANGTHFTNDACIIYLGTDEKIIFIMKDTNIAKVLMLSQLR